MAAAGEGDLEDEGLVPLEAGAGVLDVRLGVRAVDLQEGLGEGDQAAALAQGVRQGVDGLLGARQDRLDRLGDLPGLQLGGGGVEGDQGAGPGVDRLGSSSPRSNSYAGWASWRRRLKTETLPANIARVPGRSSLWGL